MLGSRDCGWKSFSGHPLAGDALVRMVFLDESGIGKKENDPLLVVAGIVVHADKMMKPLKDGLVKVRNKYITPSAHEGFIFHAKELFHGGKILRREDGWSSDKGFAVVNDMIDLLVKQQAPVVWRSVERGSISVPPEFAMKPVVAEHMVAFLATLMLVDAWMAKNAPLEVCSIVVENNEQAKTALKRSQNFYRTEKAKTLRARPDFS